VPQQFKLLPLDKTMLKPIIKRHGFSKVIKIDRLKSGKLRVSITGRFYRWCPDRCAGFTRFVVENVKGLSAIAMTPKETRLIVDPLALNGTIQDKAESLSGD
jgi:hypothetical protein